MRWIIYFGAWAGQYMAHLEYEGFRFHNPYAWNPYLEFSIAVRLEEAIKVAKVLMGAMPEHRWAISVKGRDGWAWRDDGRDPEIAEDGT